MSGEDGGTSYGEQFAGAGLLADAGALADQMSRDDWFSLAADTDRALLALDVLDTAAKPFEALVEAGVGWLVEHLSFLQEPIDLLTGVPEAIDEMAGTWSAAARELTAIADQDAQDMAAVGTWSGSAADGYRRTSAQHREALYVASGHLAHVAEGLTVAGMVVATERATVIEAVSTFLSNLIEKALLAAAAAAETAGASVASFVADAVASGARLAGRLAERLGALLTRIGRFVARFDSLGGGATRVGHALFQRGEALRAGASRMEDVATRVRTAGSRARNSMASRGREFAGRARERKPWKSKDHESAKEYGKHVGEAVARTLPERLPVGGGDSGGDAGTAAGEGAGPGGG